MATHGSHHLLVMLLLQVNVMQSLQMGHYGLLQVKVSSGFASHIPMMVLPGRAPLLERPCFQMEAHAMRWDGMEQNGWLEALERISSRIPLMESHGLRPLLELRSLQMDATQSHGMVLDG
jgi:hypothetical protein